VPTAWFEPVMQSTEEEEEGKRTATTRRVFPRIDVIYPAVADLSLRGWRLHYIIRFSEAQQVLCQPCLSVLHRTKTSYNGFLILVTNRILFFLVFDLLAEGCLESRHVALPFDALIYLFTEVVEQKYRLAIDFHRKGGASGIIVCDWFGSYRASSRRASCKCMASDFVNASTEMKIQYRNG
jgi:hypothetical protein